MAISSERFKSNTLGSTFAPLKVGQSSEAFSESTSSLTFCLAASTEMSSSNSTVIMA